MRFYRLEKKNYFAIYGSALFKAIGIGLMLVVCIMLLAGYKFMIVSSGSMEPTLPVGSLVIVTPCEYEDLKLNDIVTMNAGGVYLTHRVVGKMDNEGNVLEEDDPRYESAWWYTRGDNSETNDGRLTREIIGKVHDEHAFTFVGLMVRYVKSNYVMIIALAVIFLLFFEVLSYLKNKLIEDDVECYENDEE